ncbi:MAG: copper homeostasis protein CutC [Nocardioidaceae bacterium]|jgi:copper homeostasis protein|nr:copper homeostasis protein CutC [Nocardioidaceae bacterium]MDQ3325751.1 copper homeostasis protein CutC [Actinomycetota bacterium]
MGEPVLEVRVLHRADAEAAEAGGADRLMVVALGEQRAHAPDPGVVAEVVRASGLPVRPLLRLPADADRPDTTTGAGLDRMVGLAGEYVAAGADGVVAGFTTDQLEIDVELATALGEQLNCPWTFSRALDRTLEHRRSWRHVLGLPGVDAVLSAGSSVDAERGHQQLLDLAGDPAIAARLVAAGGVRPEHVPWLLRARVAGVQVASAVRPGGSWTRAHVDTQLVRSWRLLLDDELAARRSRS